MTNLTAIAATTTIIARKTVIKTAATLKSRTQNLPPQFMQFLTRKLFFSIVSKSQRETSLLMVSTLVYYSLDW